MPTAPLDTLETAANMARVRLNDAIQGLGGDIITDSNPFTLVYINAAWRRFQETLVNYGVTWFKPELILSGVPATTNTDPGSQCNFNWVQYFDGTSNQTTPVLPQNFISPLILWERVSGSRGSFLQMDRIDNGLPAVPKAPLNRSWEWRNGAIYLPGALNVTDIRVRYAAVFPDFVDPSTVAFSLQYIPIVRALNPFAWLICSEAAKARGDMDAEDFDKQALVSMKFMFDLDPMQGKSLGNEAELGKMTDQYARSDGPAGVRGGGLNAQ